MHTRPGNWTQVASLGGEIANHYTRGAGWSSNSIYKKVIEVGRQANRKRLLHASYIRNMPAQGMLRFIT